MDPAVDRALREAHVPALPQRQDSTADQLHDLIAVAVRMGMYDAADVIRHEYVRRKGVEDGATLPERLVSSIALALGVDPSTLTEEQLKAARLAAFLELTIRAAY